MAGLRRSGPGDRCHGRDSARSSGRGWKPSWPGPLAYGFAGDQRWTLGRIKTLIGQLFHVGYTVEGHLEAGAST